MLFVMLSLCALAGLTESVFAAAAEEDIADDVHSLGADITDLPVGETVPLPIECSRSCDIDLVLLMSFQAVSKRSRFRLCGEQLVNAIRLACRAVRGKREVSGEHNQQLPQIHCIIIIGIK